MHLKLWYVPFYKALERWSEILLMSLHAIIIKNREYVVIQKCSYELVAMNVHMN